MADQEGEQTSRPEPIFNIKDFSFEYASPNFIIPPLDMPTSFPQISIPKNLFTKTSTRDIFENMMIRPLPTEIALPSPNRFKKPIDSLLDVFDQIVLPANAEALRVAAIRNDFSGLAKQISLYVTTDKLLNYIIDQQIVNLILLDRSARPANTALQELWKKHNPDSPFPANVFYFNPTGFLETTDLVVKSPKDGLYRFERELAIGQQVGLDLGTTFLGKSKAEIQQQLLSPKHQRLLDQRDAPTLVYDNCIHYGRAMGPVLRALQAASFSQIKIAVASTHANESDIVPDFIAMTSPNFKDCYPFGMELGVEKGYTNLHSERASFATSAQSSRELRATIKQIINMYGLSLSQSRSALR